MLLAIQAFFRTLDGNAENRVTSRTVEVHLGGADAPVFVAHCHQLVHVVRIVHHEHGQVLHIDSDVRPLLDLTKK